MCKITTRELVKKCGDDWVELFPVGRKVYVIINAIDWSRKKGRIVPEISECIINKIGHDEYEPDTYWMWMESKKFGLQDAKIDGDSFLEKVFLFEDEAKAALEGKGK